MIIAYLNQYQLQPTSITKANHHLLKDAVWIDILRPSKDEEAMMEQLIHIDIPTREEMKEIEPSSRLYKENGAWFMTVTMLAKSTSSEPITDAITLIVKHNTLITLRYIEPQAFSFFIARVSKLAIQEPSATHLLLELLDATVDRLADITERLAASFDSYSQVIFRQAQHENHKLNYKHLLQELGSNGDLNAKTKESLVSLNRLMVFIEPFLSIQNNQALLRRLSTLTKDINALNDHVVFLASKVDFLLDATLGMVNIEQNNIIKIFSIAAVIFLPPTLVASIYGMNFSHLPGLGWRLGFPFSLGLMLVSAWVPYQFFKMKKWL